MSWSPVSVLIHSPNNVSNRRNPLAVCVVNPRVSKNSLVTRFLILRKYLSFSLSLTSSYSFRFTWDIHSQYTSRWNSFARNHLRFNQIKEARIEDSSWNGHSWLSRKVVLTLHSSFHSHLFHSHLSGSAFAPIFHPRSTCFLHSFLLSILLFSVLCPWWSVVTYKGEGVDGSKRVMKEIERLRDVGSGERRWKEGRKKSNVKCREWIEEK